MIIFLDVDGVLNNEQAIHDAAIAGSCIGALDNKCLERFAKLVQACVPSPTIVLSSSWRHSRQLVRILSFRLGKSGVRLSSETDMIGGERGLQIKRWLEQNPPLENEKVLILDDETFDMLPEQLPFIVKTNMATGLTDEHIQMAAEILGIQVANSGR